MQECQRKLSLDHRAEPQVPMEERSVALLQELRANRNRLDRTCLNGERTSKLARESQEAENMSPEDTKKQRRKLNKKKKRRRMQMLKQGINELKGIFQKIYYMGCNFDELRDEIIVAVAKIPEESEFVDRLDQLIREYVEDTCDYLWDEYRRINANIEKQTDSLRTKPMEAELARRLKIDFITAIYEQFYVIKISSEEIDKMIELYYELTTAHKGQLLDTNKKPLYKSTFNYMMIHEVKLKAWLIDASNSLTFDAEKDEQAIGKLRDMLQVILENEEELHDNEQSTVDSEDRQQTESSKPKQKKRKPCALLSCDEELITNPFNEEMLDQQLLLQLQQSDFKNRLDCSFQQCWLRVIEAFMRRK